MPNTSKPSKPVTSQRAMSRKTRILAAKNQSRRKANQIFGGISWPTSNGEVSTRRT